MAIRPQRMPWVILATILLLEVAASGESNPVKQRHDPPLQTLQEEPDLHDVPLINKDYRGIDPNVIESGDEILTNSVVGNRGAEEAGSATIRFYASVDAQITADDRQIGGDATLIALGPAGSLTWTQTEILVSSTTWSIWALMNTSILTGERAMALASGLLGHPST